MSDPAASHPAAVLLAATQAPSPAASPSASQALGPVQRVPIMVNGKVVGTALVRLPPASALPAAVAFRGEVDALLLAIRVSDSGPSIPADELPHIFDRFFRGRTASPSGTGIGLAVVAELARAHGGTAEAASQPGQGATFTIRLPAQAI